MKHISLLILMLCSIAGFSQSNCTSIKIDTACLKCNGQNQITLKNTGVTAGSYTNSNITVNAQGQITSASNGSGGGGGGTWGSITGTLSAQTDLQAALNLKLSIASAAATYQPIGNYVTTARTLTINGVTFDLAANRSWTITETDPVWLADKPSYLTSAIASATYSVLAHTHSFASLTSKPTTISGYGITDFNSLGDARWLGLHATADNSDKLDGFDNGDFVKVSSINQASGVAGLDGSTKLLTSVLPLSATSPITYSSGVIASDTSILHSYNYYEGRYSHLGHAHDSTTITGLHSENYYNTKYYPLLSNPAGYLTSVGTLDSTTIGDLHSEDYYNTKFYPLLSNPNGYLTTVVTDGVTVFGDGIITPLNVAPLSETDPVFLAAVDIDPLLAANSNTLVPSQKAVKSFVGALTTANVPASMNLRYVTDAQLTVITNTSGTNTGDQTSVSGNAGTVTVADAASDPSTWVLLGTSQTGNLSPASDAGLTYSANSDELTCPKFIGALTGNVNGNVTGSSASCTGNAATATTATNATNGTTVATSTNASYFPLFAASSTNGNQPFNLGTGLAFNPSTNNLSTTTFTGAFVGNASTASSAAIWTTSRSLWGNSVNGSGDISSIIASTYGGTGNGFTKFSGAATSEKTYTLPNVNATLLYSGGDAGTPSTINLTNATSPPTWNQNTTGTALNITASSNTSLTSLSNLTTHGTITSGGLGAGAVLGGVTMTLGSDADYDIYYRSSNVLTRLPNGTTGQVLKATTSAAPSWSAAVATADPASGFLVHKNGSNQTISSSAATKLTWSTETVDVGNEFASDKFTATNTGYYFIDASARVTAVGTGSTSMKLHLYKNGSLSKTLMTVTALSGLSDITLQGTAFINLTAADYVEIFIEFPGLTAGSSTVSGTASDTWFAGDRQAVGAGDAITTNPLSQFAATTISQLNGVISTYDFPTAVSTSGKWVKSDGTNLIMSTATIAEGAVTSGKFLRSDGTNWVASTPTLPTSAGTSGKVLVSDGTNYIESTPTFPNASATSGKVIKSDGTNWLASTETYPAPSTAGNRMVSDGTNWISGVPSTSGVAASPTASSTQTITHGLGRTPKTIRVNGIGAFVSNAAATPTPFSMGVYTSSGNTCVYMTSAGTSSQASQTSTTFSVFLATSSGNTVSGVIGNIGATTFDIVWTEVGTAAAQNFMWESE